MPSLSPHDNNLSKNACFQLSIWPNGHREAQKLIFSPTHKRTEGRAPVWASEFTSKDAALQRGGVGEIIARLNANVKLCDLPGGGGGRI